MSSQTAPALDAENGVETGTVDRVTAPQCRVDIVDAFENRAREPAFLCGLGHGVRGAGVDRRGKRRWGHDAVPGRRRVIHLLMIVACESTGNITGFPVAE
jgi:hypothetical protein